MGQGQVNTDITADVTQDGDKVIYKSEQNQSFDAENFVDVYNDTIQNLRNLMNKIEQTQQQITETLDEKEEAMQTIHTLVETEPQTDAELEADSLTVDDLNAFMQLQQQKKQQEQQKQQETQVRSQLHQMKNAAERVADNPDEELDKIPDKPGVEEDVELNT